MAWRAWGASRRCALCRWAGHGEGIPPFALPADQRKSRRVSWVSQAFTAYSGLRRAEATPATDVVATAAAASASAGALAPTVAPAPAAVLEGAQPYVPQVADAEQLLEEIDACGVRAAGGAPRGTPPAQWAGLEAFSALCPPSCDRCLRPRRRDLRPA